MWTKYFGSIVHREIIARFCVKEMGRRGKKRKRRNRLIIAVASIVIAFLIAVMILVTIFSLDTDSSEGTKFLLMDIPLAFAIVMVFFFAKDRLK